MDLGLNGKIALVTGGSEGIGFAAAKELASEGAKEALEGLKIIPRRSPFDSHTNLITV